ncbi:MAG: tyrosine-type recombinase/integrase [Thermoanaerobaculia bacterium]|nr:tyrosine-type recombinase/integrase [Thermoanaerobaculia bacterium]
MTRPRAFASWLAAHFESFVALRQASGAVYLAQRKWLLAFDGYLDRQAAQPPLRRETLLRYLASLEHLSPRGRDNVVSVVWPALSHARRHGAEVEALPARPPKPAAHWRQRQPHIVSVAELEALLDAARGLPPSGSLRPVTCTTLLGLLWTTGMRIGEALALDVGDLDRRDRILTIRKGKFGKTRILPLRESTAQALARYIDHPLRSVGTEPSAPLFLSGRHRPCYSVARAALCSACLVAELPKPWPRWHDFRHAFAVNHVAEWYEQGRDVDALLPALSTYLGHLSVENTRHYLVANGLLLEQAAHRFERQTRALDEVLS